MGVVAELFAGASLGLLFTRSTPRLKSTHAAEAISLFSGPTSLRQGTVHGLGRSALASIPGASPWKEIALAAIEDSSTCGRDVSMKAHSQLRTVMSNLNSEHKAQVEKLKLIVNA